MWLGNAAADLELPEAVLGVTTTVIVAIGILNVRRTGPRVIRGNHGRPVGRFPTGSSSISGTAIARRGKRPAHHTHTHSTTFAPSSTRWTRLTSGQRQKTERHIPRVGELYE